MQSRRIREIYLKTFSRRYSQTLNCVYIADGQKSTKHKVPVRINFSGENKLVICNRELVPSL